jgi:hypothetical protein
MAGGATWVLSSKTDNRESWKKQIEEGGVVTRVELWIRDSVSITIRQRVRVDGITLGPGEIGEEDGSITCRTGAGQFASVHSRRSLSGSLFVCVLDEVNEEQPFADWYIRTQAWESIGVDEKVGEETP